MSEPTPAPPTSRAGVSIWAFAFGYFACYVPYSALTKVLSKGTWPAGSSPVAGNALLPLATLSAVLVAGLFLTAMGWWGHARQVPIGSLRLPAPRLVTLLSGLCTAAILTTTTLAYTISGVSILLMMLAMRGGVLVIAPVVDLATGRRPRPAGWVSLGIALAALWVATSGPSEGGLNGTAILTLIAYLGAYFVRLQLMTRFAKSHDRANTLAYFVEEQLVTTPSTLLILGAIALLGGGALASELRVGFGGLEPSVALATLAVGALSQGTGIFGTLVFLDPRENTYAVLVNRCASILAGVAASYVLWGVFGLAAPAVEQLVGAGLMILAIAVLALSDRFTLWRAKA
jgi:hypothetical protein